MLIVKQDSNGVKPLLQTGELGYDNYPAGGDKGRVFVGTGTENIGLAKKIEVVAVDTKADTHITRVDNPHAVTKAQVGLGNVDNTSDINKPVSTATQNALNLKANAANAALTGVPTAPTAAVGTSTTQIATTAYVNAEIANDTYSKTQLDAGQLDNRYYTETKLNSGALDTRYYTEAEIDTKLAAQNDASEIVVVPTGNLASTNAQAALVELQGDIDNRYTKSETTTLLAGKVDKTENQNIDGIITFIKSPIVPTPTSDTQAVNKVYVDSQITNRKSIFTGAYGLDWNETTDTYTRTGSDNYLAIQSLVRRCVLKADGTVNYYLHPDNSNFKEDGTPSKLDGTDGNVMVEVPKFYYKYEYVTSNGNIIHRHSVSLTPEVGYEVYWSHMHPTEKAYRYYPAYQGYNSGGVLKSISGVYPTTNQSIATFRSQATANGSGWHQIDFSLYEALTLLCIIEYGTMNIQGALGQGRAMLTGGSWTGGSLIGITGLSNSLGNKSGNYTFAGSADAPEADLSFMSYRGCENFFGNVWRFADGINATGANSKTIYVNNNPATYASDVFTGDYYSTGVVTAGTGGYARKLGNSNKGFFPTDVTGGASNIGATDYYYTSSTVNTIALVGGAANDALAAGPLSLRVNNASSLVHVSVGSGVAR